MSSPTPYGETHLGGPVTYRRYYNEKQKVSVQHEQPRRRSPLFLLPDLRDFSGHGEYVIINDQG